MDSLYDRALLEVGNEGKFQKTFDIIYNVVFACLWAMAYNNMILALVVTPHTCKIPEKPENVSEFEWTSKYIPIVESVTGLQKYSDCLIYSSLESNETKGCENFDYDRTWYETTVASDNNWVCDNEINVANILAYSRIGEIIGSFIFGWFGDVYGRRLTYIIALLLLVVGRFLCVIASPSYSLFLIGCIIAAIPSWSATQSASVISLEISSPMRRATVAKLRLIATSSGLFLMPFFFWWLRNWKSFLIITTVSQLIFLLFAWKIIESPQWLWINGKSKDALRNLKHIAEINKTTLSLDTEKEILVTKPAKNRNDALGPLALFSGWRIAITTILQLFLWFTVSANYAVAMMSSGEKSDGNPFLEFAWQSLAEIPGYFVAAWLADRIGRRYTGIASFSITTIIWIFYGFRQLSDVAWLKYDWLVTMIVVINRSSITISYYIINLFNMELYPTCLRQSGMSLGNVVSGGASAIAPYILYLGRRVDVRYPSAILTLSSVFGGIISTFFLPETLNRKLPETMEDAQKFGSYTATVREQPEEMQLNNTN